MTTTVFTDISAALDSRLNAMVGKPPIAWENTAYTPVDGTLYVRPFVLPATTVQAGLGSSGLDEHLGIYQVTIYAPVSVGRGEATAMADTIANHFKRGTDLVYNGVTVRLGNVSRNSGLVVDDRFVIAVSINYSAHVAPR